MTSFDESRRFIASLLLLAALGACGQTRDLGENVTGSLPVDHRNPIVLANDSSEENWQGEYAMLFAQGQGPPLAGIIVSASAPWPDIDVNIAGWRSLVAAARASGMRGVPDPIASVSSTLVRPTSGMIDDTVANRSEGARLIVSASKALALPYRPLVVVTGGRLTDVADAYLIEPAVAERVVVVSSLGSSSDTGGVMGMPNGEMDPWADFIVASRFRFVQVSAFYDQTADLPATRVNELPVNPFGAWMASKQTKIWSLNRAADQVAVLSVAFSSFASRVTRVAVVANATDPKGVPSLMASDAGPGWLVTQVAPMDAVAEVWHLLGQSRTFGGP